MAKIVRLLRFGQCWIQSEFPCTLFIILVEICPFGKCHKPVENNLALRHGTLP